MKRGVYITLTILLCSFVYSLTISLDSPSNRAVLSGQEPLAVSVSRTEEEEITAVFFYYQDSPKSPWQEIGVDTDINNDSYTITFDTTTVEDSTTARIFANATNSNGSMLDKTSEVSVDIDNIPDNNPPSIDSFSPNSNPTVTISEEGTTITYKFKINKSDLDKDNLTTAWYLDDQLVKNNSDEYTFSGNTTGNHTIKVTVSDGISSKTKEWTLTLISGWIKVPENKTKEITSVCGNGKVEAGEDCKTCSKDVKCPSDSVCSKEGKCIKEKKPKRWPIVLILLFIVIITIAIVVIYNKRAEKVYGSSVPSEKTKEQPAEISDFYKEPVKPKPKETKIKKVIEPKKPKTVGSILLKNYIQGSIAKGKSLAEIKDSLLKKGWKLEDIEEALKEYDTKKRA